MIQYQGVELWEIQLKCSGIREPSRLATGGGNKGRVVRKSRPQGLEGRGGIKRGWCGRNRCGGRKGGGLGSGWMRLNGGNLS
jgi:hypothetical protein